MSTGLKANATTAFRAASRDTFGTMEAQIER
jgi:hypothetical protein